LLPPEHSPAARPDDIHCRQATVLQPMRRCWAVWQTAAACSKWVEYNSWRI